MEIVVWVLLGLLLILLLGMAVAVLFPLFVGWLAMRFMRGEPKERPPP